MTVFRASRNAVLGVLRVGCAVLVVLAFPVASVRADDSAVVAPSSTSTLSSNGTASSNSAVRVASEAPVPAAAGAPRVGPLDAGVGNAPGRGVWWLFALGGVQVAGLFFMTRRSRARLSTHDPAP